MIGSIKHEEVLKSNVLLTHLFYVIGITAGDSHSFYFLSNREYIHSHFDISLSLVKDIFIRPTDKVVVIINTSICTQPVVADWNRNRLQLMFLMQLWQLNFLDNLTHFLLCQGCRHHGLEDLFVKLLS